MGYTAPKTWAYKEVLSSSDLNTYVKDNINFLTGNAPRGFLLNGKIFPSVTSNNLTVAIKGLDGNDPSATNPVYCRIGDTIRTITAALSVTKNAATNWCNAGSAELATKEIDYFVYLGYNATDGVVIGFSRIPYATEYDEFSATTTNEKFCAISTISNAAAGDDYENIGRFAATLSAGAGYTWTVPTFTNKNLIQRPIYETRRLTYLPVPTGFSGTPEATGTYKIMGNTCKLLNLYVAGTSNDAGFTVTLPFSSAVRTFCMDVRVMDNSGWQNAGLAGFSTNNILTLYLDGAESTFATSNAKRLDTYQKEYEI
jgi:hypothetical protein